MDVLTPVAPRRRRRRYRAGRIALLALVVLLAAGAGVWFGRRSANGSHRSAAPPQPVATPAAPTVSHPTAPRPPLHLLTGSPLLGAEKEVRGVILLMDEQATKEPEAHPLNE